MKFISEKSAYFLLIVLLSIFPAYNAMVNGSGHHHLKHHLDFFSATSDYFNPWQYRVLAPLLVEAFHRILDFLFYRDQPSAEAYYTTFKIFRTLQHFVIFCSAWFFFRYFSENKPLRLLMLIILAWAFHAAAYMSDFAFNTYFEILFFIWAAWLLYARQNYWWFLPLMLMAALNRESSLMLPFLLLPELLINKNVKTRKTISMVFASCLVIYGFVFFGIRHYFGYLPPAPIGMETGWPIFQFNLTDPVTLLQLFSTLCVLPLFALLAIRKADRRLQLLFLLLVPGWFFIHFWLVWARETRIFLVPVAIIFLPAILNYIQQSFESAKRT